jgi:hypothetical protein
MPVPADGPKRVVAVRAVVVAIDSPPSRAVAPSSRTGLARDALPSVSGSLF